MSKLVEGKAALRLLLFAAIGLVCYFNALQTPFVFDDTSGIVENPGVRQLWPPALVMAKT